MGATIYSLAPELLDHILDLVRGPGGATDDSIFPPTNSDLLSAALVSRKWRETAQRVLWHDARVTLDPKKRPLPNFPGKKNVVTHLGIFFSNLVPSANALNTIPVTDWIGAWLEEAPQLKSLCIQAHAPYSDFDTASPYKWNFLRSLSLQGLKRLDLIFCEDVKDPDDLQTPLPFHLTHLGLHLFARPPSSHLLLALFSTSVGTLTSLRLSINCSERWADPGLLRTGVELVASNVETLDIDFCGGDFDRPSHGRPMSQISAYPNLSTFTSLKHLIISIPDDRFSDPEELILIEPILRQLTLPATLIHLTFPMCDPPSVKQITDNIELPALDNLERIDFTRFDLEDLEAQEEGVKLVEECARRGIKLLFWEDLL